MLKSGNYVPAEELKPGDELYSYNEPIFVKEVDSIHYSDPIPVFDMEVPKTHNFLLNSGVFVHNSKDMADSLAGALWNATLHKQDLIDGLELLNTAIEVNDDVNPAEAFKANLQQSLLSQRNNNIYNKLDELISGYGSNDIISW